MNSITKLSALTERDKPSEDDIARAIALLSEGLLTQHEFHALTGIDRQELRQYLADADKSAGVQRAALQLRNAGAVARLGALRHARDAVEIAAGIMQDAEMHPSTRLNAATFIAKVSGTERPAQEPGDPPERHTVVINVGGDRPPLIISSAHEESKPAGEKYELP